MTVKELKEILSNFTDNEKVVIPVNPSKHYFGGQPYVEVTNVHVGIDWDSGKCWISTKEQLKVKKEK